LLDTKDIVKFGRVWFKVNFISSDVEKIEALETSKRELCRSIIAENTPWYHKWNNTFFTNESAINQIDDFESDDERVEPV